MAATGSTDNSSKAILHMSERSAKDASRTKTLTFAALVFVPASFIAVGIPTQRLGARVSGHRYKLTSRLVVSKEFLQLGYVTVAQKGGFVVSAQKGVWLYALLAFPLILSTLGILVVLEISEKRRQRRSFLGRFMQA